MVKILHRYTKEVIFEGEGAIKDVVEMAVKDRVSLKYAGLKGANLIDANLRHADLGGVDLSGADLTGAILDGVVGLSDDRSK